MRLAAIALAIGLAPLAVAIQDRSAPQLAPQRGLLVEVHDEDGQLLLTVEARDVRTSVLVETIARKLNLEPPDLDTSGRDPLVSAFLRRQPHKDALRWVLGSVGMRADVNRRHLRVFDDVPPYPTAVDLLREANRRYVQALRQYPDWPLADRAEMARAEINENLGPDFWGAAALSYDALIQDYPGSDLLPEALLRSARLAGRLEKWDHAVLRYEELASLERVHDHHVTARLELAYALCRAGESSEDLIRHEDLGTKAIYYLDALDSHYPTQESSGRRARFLVRSRAYALQGMAILAMRALDTAAQYSVAGESDPEVLELRARALARAGEHASSATAWLAYAEVLVGEERERAFVEAARAALEAGHEIATLTIAKAAEAENFGERLAPFANEARVRLGLPAEELSAFDAVQHLERGEDLLERRMYVQAAGALRLAYGLREELSTDGLLRLGLAYARALDRSERFSDAIGVLRNVASELDGPQQRTEIYRFASRLHEERLQYAQAIEALQGRL